MAQPEMHCTFQRALSDTQRLSDGVKGSLSKISLEENNLRTSLEDFKICSQGYRSTKDRCTVLTFLTLESDGHWKVVALPLQCLEHDNLVECGAQVNMDGLHLVSPQLIRSCKIDQFQVLKRPPFDVTYSTFTSGSFQGLNGQRRSRNKALTDKATKSIEKCGNLSLESLFTCIDSPLLVPNSSDTIQLPDVFIKRQSFKLDDTVKRSSKKKTRKKGKHNKKLSVSTELEESEEYAIGNLTSEICCNRDHGCGSVSYATSQELSLLDCTVNGNAFGVNSLGFISYSAAPTACTSSIDGILAEDRGLSLFDRADSTHNVQIRCYDEMYSQGVPDMLDSLVLDPGPVDSKNDGRNCYGDLYIKGISDVRGDSLLLDSVSIGSNSDDSSDASHDVKPCKNGGCRISDSEPPKVFLSHGNLLNDTVDGCDLTEIMKCDSQGSSSSDMQLAVSGKGRKQSKMVSRSSNVNRVGSVGASHGRHTGKENNHSVWQKVQRKDADGCNKQVKKDISLKEAPLLKRNGNAAQVNISSKTGDNKQLKEKNSRKSKRKSSQALKQEFCSRNKSPANACSKVSMQQNELLDVSSQLDQKRLRSLSRSNTQIGSPKDGPQANSMEGMTTESVHYQPVCADEVGPSESVCKAVSQSIGNLESTFSKSSESLCQSNLLQVKSPLYLPHLLANEVTQTQKEISLLENSKPNHNSGSVLQKWVPVGLKNSGITCSSVSESLTPDNCEEPTTDSSTMKNIPPEKGVSDSQDVVFPNNVGVELMSQSYENVCCSSGSHESQTQRKNHSGCNIKENCNSSGAPIRYSAESKDQSFGLIEIDSSKLDQAVNHACRVQLASEAVQIATGGPIAEFERLLQFTSPVVCELHNTSSCQTCPQDQISDALLCRHETPNIPLGCLWQWYEKHGSYGLEVKTEDNKNTKRLGVDSSAFRAYFVPLLSAIQLFSNSKSQSLGKGNSIPGDDVLEAPASDKSDNSSNVGHLPIFSLLVPHPRTEHTSVSPVHNSEMPSASAPGGVSNQSADNTSSNDPELLFEYFESEQPQQRQPLYDKITELVRGDGPSQCKMYGDPTKLNSINLHDLHPRSWYSVAWYPIYRIPDGNLRAAFLTYHSLGHLTRRSPKFDSHGAEASIISPVVGLQSYNAQGECWFQMRHLPAETESLNASGILKERLRTLEETASLMARAVVNKGGSTSVNRHPDYEFFLSRRRY